MGDDRIFAPPHNKPVVQLNQYPKSLFRMPATTMSLAFLTFFIVVLLIWTIILQVQLLNIKKHYSTLLAGVDVPDLQTAWDRHLARIEQLLQATTTISEAQARLANTMKQVVQRVGFLRYNSLGDVGGEQSFVIALLDDTGTGVVIDSIHTRSGTRVYAKQIERGKASLKLSEEEEQTIQSAIASKNN